MKDNVLNWWPSMGKKHAGMDISRFDFDLDEVTALLPRLALLAERIEIDPRLHDSGEMVHSSRDTTFRLTCRARETDRLVSRLADLEATTGIEAVLLPGLVFGLGHPQSSQEGAAEDSR